MNSPKHTIRACYLAYITQAIVNNYLPLLFVMFHANYGISLIKLTMLTSCNFVFQLLTDFLSAPVVQKLSNRVSIVLAHVLCGMGFLSLAFLPGLFTDPFIGLLIAVFLNAIGGGLIEVLVSPIVESCPNEHAAKAMSLLHSFYCWGYLGVILVSTLFFHCFSIQHWNLLAALYAFLPLCNAVYFLFVPLYPFVKEEHKESSYRDLFTSQIFWILVVLMICAGASEMGMSQWSSSFMETSLHLSKSAGDLLGPASFALCMGISRAYYGKRGEKVALKRFMAVCAVLCTFCYITASMLQVSVIPFFSCAICGFAIGIFWPGTFSYAAKSLPQGGIRMYALLALAGDIGCSFGSSMVGTVASLFNNNLRIGLGAMILFPLLFLFALFKLSSQKR